MTSLLSLFKTNIKEEIKKLVSKNLGLKAWVHVMFLRWNSIKSDWCFDIPVMGIENEPFVSGMEDIIDKQLIKAGKIKDAKNTAYVFYLAEVIINPKSFLGVIIFI